MARFAAFNFVGRVVMVLAAVTLTSAACSSDTSGPTPSSNGGSSAAATAPYCAEMSQSADLKDIDKVLTDLSDPATEDAAKSKIKKAAAALRTIGQSAGQPLSSKFESAATALDTLAAKGITDGDAVNGASSALTALGSEVESVCHFPIG